MSRQDAFLLVNILFQNVQMLYIYNINHNRDNARIGSVEVKSEKVSEKHAVIF